MLEGKVAWVTGATGGVGPAVVHALFDAGASIVATARDESRLALLQVETRADDGRWLAHAEDLTNPAAAHAIVEAASTRFGGVDILIAVAGGWRGGVTVAGTELETLRWLVDLNLVTGFNACPADAHPVRRRRNKTIRRDR